MTIGLSLDLAVFSISIAILYAFAKKDSWEKMLAKYMWMILAISTTVQMTIDYPSFSLVITGLLLFFIGIFIFELFIDGFGIIQNVLKPLLHKKFR